MVIKFGRTEGQIAIFFKRFALENWLRHQAQDFLTKNMVIKNMVIKYMVIKVHGIYTGNCM